MNLIYWMLYMCEYGCTHTYMCMCMTIYTHIVQVYTYMYQFSSVQSLSRVWLFATPMDCSTSGFPVHHQLPELTQTHVHWVSDAIQPSHPLSSPSPPAFNLAQHQGLFQWVSSSHHVAKVLVFKLQHMHVCLLFIKVINGYLFTVYIYIYIYIYKLIFIQKSL